MKNKIFPTYSKALFSLSVLLLLSVSTYSQLKVGTAAVKITPPLGTPLAGQYFERGAAVIHDDLFAKAMVFEKDGEKVVLVSCDLVEVTAQLVSEARRLANQNTGIVANHIMIAATHSHTGPVIPSPGNINTVKVKSADILANYISKLPGLIAESIKLANDALQPANILFGLGHEETISFNRRFFMTDGTVGWNPGKLNPMIIKPAGPIDPDVSVLYAESLTGKPILTFVDFAIHLDITGGSEISADMPYSLSKNLERVKGADMTTIFAQGCSGNINHIDVKSAVAQYGHMEAERIGAVLAGEVIRTYSQLKPFAVPDISVKSEIIQLPLAKISTDDLEWAREVAGKYGKVDAAPFMDMVKAFKIIDVYERKGKLMDAEVQVFALGNTCAIVSLPGEIFTELGMYIKSRSPYPNTILVELANDCIDYIPDMKAYMEGNYEPVSARCAPGSGEILAAKVLEMLNEMKHN